MARIMTIGEILVEIMATERGLCGLAFADEVVTTVMSVRPASLVSARASDRVGPRWLPWSETETPSSRVRCGSDGDHPVDRPHRQDRADRDQR